MTRAMQLLVFVLTLFSLAAGQQVSSGNAGYHATFQGSYGEVIKLDIRNGSLDTPCGRSTGLEDCSDKLQVCLTNHQGFAFAYFRKCNDPELWDYTRLRFIPKVISVLHNTDLWMVFDAAPNYLFHYAYSKGILGIYIGPTASYDFRIAFHDRSFRSSTLQEFRIAGSDTVAACQ